MLERLLMLVLIMGLCPAYSWSAALTARYSLDSQQRELPGPSLFAGMSANGRYLLFYSAEQVLPQFETSRVYPQIYLVDTVTRAVDLITQNNLGEVADAAGYTGENYVSDDGRYVTFRSRAENLVAGTLDRCYLRDRHAGTTIVMGTARSICRLSANGQWVLGRFAACEPLSSTGFCLVRRDLSSARAVVLPEGIVGPLGGGDPSYLKIMSHDGRYVLRYGNQADGTDYGLYRLDTLEQSHVRIDQPEMDEIGGASISGDGSWVALNATPFGLPACRSGPVLKNLESGELIHILTQAQRCSGISGPPMISGDGRFVAFTSNSRQLDPRDTGSDWDVFVFDRLDRSIRLVSLGSNGIQGDFGVHGGGSFEAFSNGMDISIGGRHIAFSSFSTNLDLQPDQNNALDVFVHLPFGPVLPPAAVVSLPTLSRPAAALLFGLLIGSFWVLARSRRGCSA